MQFKTIRYKLISKNNQIKFNFGFHYNNIDNGIHFYDNKNNPYIQEKHNKICPWCKNNFDEIPLPIPIRQIKKNVYIGELFFCSFECCYAFLRDDEEKIEGKRDFHYKNSIILLKKIFVELYPNEKLELAPDWKLLENVGMGKLTIKDFRQNSHNFIRTSNLKIFPEVIKYFEKKNI